MRYDNYNIISLADGRMLQILPGQRIGGRNKVQFINENEPTYVALELFSIVDDLGQTPEVLAAFFAAKSIHLRLNR